ncbi:MAG TPA: thioredoxin family protein [Ignavibacteriaceae bacterium]|nr:thioredoxin family protein [Ignavibacteriaceae bacterium]
MNFNVIKYRLIEKGMSYTEFINSTIEEIAKTNISELQDKELSRFNFKVLNLQRSSRITRTYKISDELKNIINEISEPQLWMVITENWCGDSAQNLPYIAAIAGENILITLRVILRDSNPDIMDQCLTNGTRSIPKLIAFNNSGDELFRWGPRPKAAVNLINQWKEEDLEKSVWTEKLHSWYSRNKGFEIEKEFIELIASSVVNRV